MPGLFDLLEIRDLTFAIGCSSRRSVTSRAAVEQAFASQARADSILRR
jgi:hypothetical protein